MNIPKAKAAIEAARELLADHAAIGYPYAYTADALLVDALAELEPSAEICSVCQGTGDDPKSDSVYGLPCGNCQGTGLVDPIDRAEETSAEIGRLTQRLSELP